MKLKFFINRLALSTATWLSTVSIGFASIFALVIFHDSYVAYSGLKIAKHSILNSINPNGDANEEIEKIEKHLENTYCKLAPIKDSYQDIEGIDNRHFRVWLNKEKEDKCFVSFNIRGTWGDRSQSNISFLWFPLAIIAIAAGVVMLIIILNDRIAKWLPK